MNIKVKDMKDRERKIINVSWQGWLDRSGWCSIFGSCLLLSGPIIEDRLHLPQLLTLPVALVFSVIIPSIPMATVWRKVNREAKAREKEFQAKATAANVYLFGTNREPN